MGGGERDGGVGHVSVSFLFVSFFFFLFFFKKRGEKFIFSCLLLVIMCLADEIAVLLRNDRGRRPRAHGKRVHWS